MVEKLQKGLKMMKKLSRFLMLMCLLSMNVFAGGVKEISSPAELDLALASGGVVVADFFATWCGPCKMLAPILDELSGQYAGKVTFLKIDVDKHQDLASKYGISSIPDVRIFKDNTQTEQMIGMQGKENYQSVLDALTQ